MVKALIKIILVLAAVTAACYYSFNIIMSAVVHSKKEIVLPDVTGKSLVEAVEEVSQMGLGIRKDGEEFNQNVPPGLILRQAPPAGMNVREGKIIKVTLSQGGEMIYVPDLKGQTVRAADITLKAANLIIGEISKKYSVTAEKGMVLSQDPAAGSSVDKDAIINLVVSDGNPPEGVILMPAWEGKKGADARAWAVKEGITVELKSEPAPNVVPGIVMKQYPAPDTDLGRVETVVFYVAAETSEDRSAELVFNYSIPTPGGSKRVNLVLYDDNGEKSLLNAVRKPGTKISIPVQAKGKALVKVYINKVFIEDISLN